MYYHWKTELIGYPLDKKKMLQPQKCTLWEEVTKNLKTYFPLVTTFHNFTLKIEIGWAKLVVKSILETWDVNDVIVYVWFIFG